MADDTYTTDLIWLLGKSCDLMATREVAGLIEKSLAAVLHLSQGERAYFYELERTSGRALMHSGRDRKGLAIVDSDSRVQAVVAQSIKDKRSIMATDTGGADPAALGIRGAGALRVKLLVCLPLLYEGEVVGALYADGKASPERQVFVKALELLGEQVAVCLENARMFERATNDLLTGLPNNSFFLFHLGKALLAATPQRMGGVLLLDLDAFKRVNQAAGAEMGDQALIDIAHTLREVLRTDGLVARYGSDKFAVLLPPDDALSINLRLRDVAERARAAIGTKNYYGVALSVSIGGVAYPSSPKHKAQDIVALADDVLARARARGNGQVEVEVQTKA
jgi:diguanylate cyclase (GGDEF)-like protein